MNLPRDFEIQNRTGLVKFARVYSNVVSPPVMFAILGLAISLKIMPFWPGLGWAAVYGFLVSLAPILFVLYLLKTGRITELHMSNTRERSIPYLSAILHMQRPLSLPCSLLVSLPGLMGRSCCAVCSSST